MDKEIVKNTQKQEVAGIAEDRDFKGVWIPKEVWLSKDLNAIEKIILVEIDSLDCGNRGCFASNKYLAEFCQCSESKVSRAITKLTDLGYIRFKNFDGRNRKLQSRLGKMPRQTGQKSKADKANCPHNNIDNNKINNNSKEKNIKKEIIKAPIKEILVSFSDNEEVTNTLLEFATVRAENKTALTEIGAKKLLTKLEKLTKDPGEQIEIINNSIINNWKSVFALKKDKTLKEPKKSNVPPELREILKF